MLGEDEDQARYVVQSVKKVCHWPETRSVEKSKSIFVFLCTQLSTSLFVSYLDLGIYNPALALQQVSGVVAATTEPTVLHSSKASITRSIREALLTHMKLQMLSMMKAGCLSHDQGRSCPLFSSL